MKTLFCLLAVLVAPPVTSSVTSTPSITLSIEAPARVHLGDDLRIRVTVSNQGADVIQLPRTYREDGVPAQLSISVNAGRCEKVLRGFRRGKAVSAVDLVALYPGESLTFSLPPLNRNVIFHEIWAEAGVAELRARYASDLADARSVGVITSSPVRVEFVDPPAETTAPRREELRRCIAAGGSHCDEYVAYFAAVKDDEAADLLVSLLRARPYHSYVAKAIANQTRVADIAELEAIARQDAADAQFLFARADLIRQRGDRECAGVANGSK